MSSCWILQLISKPSMLLCWPARCRLELVMPCLISMQPIKVPLQAKLPASFASREYLRLRSSLLSSATGFVQAADLIVNTLKAISNSRPGMAQKFLDLAVLVLQHGEVERVIYRLGDWSRTADPSLMRHFIFHALEACAPPYSAYFASFLLTYGLPHHPRSSCWQPAIRQ